MSKIPMPKDESDQMDEMVEAVDDALKNKQNKEEIKEKADDAGTSGSGEKPKEADRNNTGIADVKGGELPRDITGISRNGITEEVFNAYKAEVKGYIIKLEDEILNLMKAKAQGKATNVKENDAEEEDVEFRKRWEGTGLIV
jgi:hypothetical protein